MVAHTSNPRRQTLSELQVLGQPDSQNQDSGQLHLGSEGNHRKQEAGGDGACYHVSCHEDNELNLHCVSTISQPNEMFPFIEVAMVMVSLHSNRKPN